MKKRGLPESRKQSLIKSLIENIRDNYYLACFTEASPFNSQEMWSTFANNGDGYCIEYSSDDIMAALVEKGLSVNSIRPVLYNKKPFYLDDIIDCFFFNHDVFKEIKNGNLDGAIEKVPELIKAQVIEILLNKVNKCRKEKEYRLIFQRIAPSGEKNLDFDPSLLRVKPKSIIVPKRLNILTQSRLISYAEKQGVDYSLVEAPLTAIV